MLIQKASVYLAIDILPINIDQGSVALPGPVACALGQ